jgi:hypothetical protein
MLVKFSLSPGQSHPFIEVSLSLVSMESPLILLLLTVRRELERGSQRREKGRGGAFLVEA